jgi:hypothetical protein
MLREQEISPALVMVAIDAVEREFREIKRRTEVGARWSDDGVERVARLLEEVRLNGARLGFQGTRDANIDKLSKTSYYAASGCLPVRE